MRKYEQLMEDGKVFIDKMELRGLTSILEQEGVKYFVFDANVTEYLVELDIPEEEDEEDGDHDPSPSPIYKTENPVPLKEAWINFYKAAQTLLISYTDSECIGEDGVLIEKFANKYPFEQSFDELISDIKVWTENGTGEEQ